MHNRGNNAKNLGHSSVVVGENMLQNWAFTSLTSIEIYNLRLAQITAFKIF